MEFTAQQVDAVRCSAVSVFDNAKYAFLLKIGRQGEAIT